MFHGVELVTQKKNFYKNPQVNNFKFDVNFRKLMFKARIPNQSLRSETMNFSIAYLSPDVTQNFFHEKTFSNHLPTPWTLNVTWTHIKRLLYFLDTFGLNSTSSLNSGMHPKSQWSFLKTHYLKRVQIRSFFWSSFSCIWTEYEDWIQS